MNVLRGRACTFTFLTRQPQGIGFMQLASVTTLFSAALLLASTGDALAADITRFQIRAAVNVCQGSLPSFEGALRKRPLAIANEGTTGAFVGCSLEANNMFNYERTSVAAIFVNRGAAAATVNCTLVNGLLNRLTPTYFPKSATIAPRGEAVLNWSAPEFPDGFEFPNLNCSLPQGVEIGWISDVYPEPVGE
ncbi:MULTISPECIES: hypothetical protein [unclassified Luteimonas]